MIACAAWGIEAYRLTNALATEASYRERYEASRLEVTHFKMLYARVEHLAEIARQVREIQLSGNRTAALFADVGNRLSPHVWLTAISNDDGKIAMTGAAADFSALGRTITGLTNARAHYAPALIEAKRDPRAAHTAPLLYDIHLDGIR